MTLRNLPTRPDWLDHAACRGHNPTMWDTPNHTNIPTRANQAALDICADCPVATHCLTETLHHETGLSTTRRAGIYGGTTPAQRARIDTAPLRARRKPRTP